MSKVMFSFTLSHVFNASILLFLKTKSKAFLHPLGAYYPLKLIIIEMVYDSL